MKKVKPVLWTRFDAKNEYPIKLRFFLESEGKYKYLNLNIGLPALKYFNPKTGEVRESYPKHIEYNNIIKDALLAFKPEDKLNSGESFLEFLKQHYTLLLEQKKFGNHKKFKVLYSKLTEYLKEKDLKFNQIDINFLKGFQNYLVNDGLNPNTIQIYLNKLKRLYNIARHEKKIVGENVFEFFKYHGQSTVSKALTAEEFKIFAYTEINDKRLQKVRKEALLLFFSNGARIGDFLRLRWSAVQGNHLCYKMQKTGKEMNVVINKPLARLLCELLPPDEQVTHEVIKLYSYEKQIKYLQYYCVYHPYEYILDYMQGLEFKDDFEKYNKIQTITATWNKTMKDLCKYLIIRPISSHSMRHTFASQLVQENSIQVVQQSLGHANILISQKYLKTLDNSQLDTANSTFYDKF